MIINKFPYATLSRTSIDGCRYYMTPEGEPLPSVTSILSATKSEEDKAGLENWRKSIGHVKAKEITATAASRGTRLHKYLEDYILTGELSEPGSNPYSKQAHKMAKAIIEQGLVNCQEFWGTEVSLYCNPFYAGTTDLVGVHNNEPAILDFKQSNKLKKREYIEDYMYQLVAYAMAHDSVYGTKINKGVILMCTADLIYQEFILEGDEFQYYTAKWWEKLEDYYHGVANPG